MQQAMQAQGAGGHVSGRPGLTGVVATVFASPALTGTRATVWLTEQPPPADVMAQLQAVDAHEACCFSWREHDRVRALCFNGGVAVRFCGHGLLACVAAWRRAGGPVQAIDSGTARYRVRWEAPDTFWLSTRAIRCSAVSQVPRDWFDMLPQSAARAGDDEGYWVLRWPRGFDLGRLQPDLDAICRGTRRAVIATAQAERGHDHDVCLRYFAPQYGKREDTATGSAAAVLGAFWGRPELVALQIPSGSTPGGDGRSLGGRIRIAAEGAEIRIGGTVTLDAPAVTAFGCDHHGEVAAGR